mgnify:CR=1 FL=1
MPLSSTVEVKFIFFKVDYAPSVPQKLPELLQNIQEISIGQRLVKINDVPRFLTDELVNHLSYKSFLFTNKKMKGIPSKIKEDNSRESLGLEENEGLAEDAAIACDPTGSVIALQQCRAMSIGVLASYLQAMLGNIQIRFTPVLTLDSFKRFYDAQEIRKVSIKVAGLVDFSVLRKWGLSVDHSIGLQKLLTSPSLEITWSASHHKQSLPHIFKELVGALKKYAGLDYRGKVVTLDAAIKNENNKTELLNILNDRIFCSAEVPMTLDREIDKTALLKAACNALVEKQNELAPFIQRQTP